MRIHLSKKERREREQLRERVLMQNINALRVDVELLDDDFDDASDIVASLTSKRHSQHVE